MWEGAHAGGMVGHMLIPVIPGLSKGTEVLLGSSDALREAWAAGVSYEAESFSVS